MNPPKGTTLGPLGKQQHQSTSQRAESVHGDSTAVQLLGAQLSSLAISRRQASALSNSLAELSANQRLSAQTWKD